MLNFFKSVKSRHTFGFLANIKYEHFTNSVELFNIFYTLACCWDFFSSQSYIPAYLEPIKPIRTVIKGPQLYYVDRNSKLGLKYIVTRIKFSFNIGPLIYDFFYCISTSFTRLYNVPIFYQFGISE